VNGAIQIGPAFGCSAPPFVGGARNSPSLVSSTIASSSMWLFHVEMFCFFWSPHQEGAPVGSRASS
jgi:hypothetical protein